MKKTYVLDTNVLLSDPESLTAFKDNDVVLPLAVIEELDHHKGRPDEVGKNARHVSKTLDSLRNSGHGLMSGIVLPSGGTLRIEAIHNRSMDCLPDELRNEKVDNRIIALLLSQEPNIRNDWILVTRDINVRIKCDFLGVRCEDYRRLRVASDLDHLYKGVNTIVTSDDIVGNFYSDGCLTVSDDALEGCHVYPNQIVIIKSQDGGSTVRSAVTRYDKKSNALLPIKNIERAYGLKPRNKEQGFALDLLFDDDVKLLTLTGGAGCGKTLISLAAALAQLKGLNSENAGYEKLIITRPIQSVGKEMGFLPGTLAEKMEPWLAPIKDNLGFLLHNKGAVRPRSRRPDASISRTTYFGEDPILSMMREKGLIEIEAISYIRGRSIPNSFILIDEAQNISMHELKTIVTRVGEGTKIVLTGDIEQIDNANVDAYTNGLTYAVERFKEHDIAGHMTLIKGERSPLATLASRIL